MINVERFWSKVHKTNSCWLWTSGTNEHGYGTFHIDRVKRYAHRVSWIIHNGPIPDGMNVCHACDNPPCVRPNHLFLGTQSDNVKDCVSKGRARGGNSKGDLNPNSKLSWKDVLNMRILFDTDKKTILELKVEYNMSYASIYNIVNRKSWMVE